MTTVRVKAADLLRLRDALTDDDIALAWSVMRDMADYDTHVALANDGNHFAEWQAIARGDKDDVLGCATTPGDCECHRRMGQDFYFLPADRCLIGNAADCTDPVRTSRRVPRDATPEPKECTHHRLTLHCPVCEREAAQAAQAATDHSMDPAVVSAVGDVLETQPDCFTEKD